MMTEKIDMGVKGLNKFDFFLEIEMLSLENKIGEIKWIHMEKRL